MCDGYITNQRKTDNRPNHNTDVCTVQSNNNELLFSFLNSILLLYIDNCRRQNTNNLSDKKLKDATAA